MSVLQRMIYTVLKALIKLVAYIYYSRIVFTGREKLKIKDPTPTIITGNHPNTLMDALNGALWVNQPVFFLAMAKLFKPDWVGKILRLLFCIPLERRKDNNGGPVNNDDTFRQAINHLSAGRNLFIAPDGGNELERNLLPLKTGTARISLAAEVQHDYQLGLKILPMGYTYYGDREQFGSEMLVQAGEPILLKDFAEANAQDHQQAVRNLTALLEKRMQDLLLNVKDEEEDQLLYALENILRDEAPLPLPQFFQRSKALLHFLRNYAVENPWEYEFFIKKVKKHQQALQSEGLRAGAVFLQQIGRSARKRRMLLFWLLVPVWAFAWLNHWPLIASVRWLVRKLDLHVGYKITVELCYGLLAVPLFYGLQSLLVEALTSTAWSWGYLLAIAVAGRIATLNRRYMEDGFSFLKLNKMRSLKQKLVEDRKAIITQLSPFLHPSEYV